MGDPFYREDIGWEDFLCYVGFVLVLLGMVAVCCAIQAYVP
ncbi:MAG: hypothetical protein ACREKR_12090 [Candidatus Methylomirabilales bacterium]